MGWLLVALGAGIGLGVCMPKAVQKGGEVIRVLLSILVAALLFLMAGPEWAVPAFISGGVLSLLVPVLVPALLSI